MTRKRFDVCGLNSEKVRERFVEKVKELVEEGWDGVSSGEEMWEVIRASMVDAAEVTLGWEERKQPDWFKEKGDQLKEQIDKRNKLFQRWLMSGRNGDRQRYVLQRRSVNSAVKKAKNEWMQEKARAVEVGMLSSGSHGSMWRELQRGKAGLRPVKTKTIRRANGDPCESVEQAVWRWQEHFSHVLNIPSQFVEETVSSVASMRVREELSEPPSEDEILVAMGTLKSGKAGGKNGMLPEMLKCCGDL